MRRASHASTRGVGWVYELYIMKGLVIFHDYEISFCHADKELERYVRERWTYLEKSAGATVRKLLGVMVYPTNQLSLFGTLRKNHC